MKPYTYSLILFLSVIVCFVAAFDKRIRFYLFFRPFLKAAILGAIPFVAWDVWFARKGVWWFNGDYTLGITLAGLPLEEWLFFLCIPFSCIFTYFCFDKFFKWEKLPGLNNVIVFVLVVCFSVITLLHHDKIYTLVAFVAATVTLIYLHLVVQSQWISKATVVYGILLLGFFPVNGILTGTGLESPIVNYRPGDFMGIRMLTIPIEDAVFGYAQFLVVLYFFQQFKKQQPI